MTVTQPIRLPISPRHIVHLDEATFASAMYEKAGARRLQIDSSAPLRSTSSLITLDGIQLLYNDTNVEVSAEFPEMDCVRLQVPVSGYQRSSIGKHEFCIGPGQYAIVPDRAQLLSTTTESHFCVRVSTDLLVRRFTSETGARPARALIFEFRSGEDDAVVTSLRWLVYALVAETAVSPEPSPVVLGNINDAIASAFLRLCRTSQDLGSDANVASHAQARLLAEYIEANADRYVSFEELASMSNVSLRSLFRAFKSVYGRSPVAFMKQQRLVSARKLLSNPAPSDTVLATAYRLGFRNAGHFAKDYERLFGERPSDTLRRSKGDSSRS